MNRFEFSINLSAQEYLQYYRGNVNKVVAQCADGTSIQFPALLLKPFVTSGGIRGNFVLTCDESGKGSEIKRVMLLKFRILFETEARKRPNPALGRSYDGKAS